MRLTKETTGSQSIAYTNDSYNRITKKSYVIDGTTLNLPILTTPTGNYLQKHSPTACPKTTHTIATATYHALRWAQPVCGSWPQWYKIN